MASPYKRMVAIAGFPEPLGLQVLNELWRQVPTPRFNLPIIVLTTDPRAAARRGGRDFGWVQYLGVDYKNLSAIVAILEDYEVKSVINLLGLNDYDPASTVLGEASWMAGVDLYIPSEFGPEHTGYNCPPSFRAKQEHAENMRARQIKTVQIFCGMVLEWSLTPQYGIDFSRGEVNAVVPDKGPEPKVTFTSIIDVARTIATLVARYTPGQLPDSVKISGDALTLRELSQVCETIYRRPFTYRTIDVGQHRAYNSSTGTTISAYYQLLTGEGRLDFSTWNHNSWIPGTWLTVRDYLSLGQGNT